LEISEVGELDEPEPFVDKKLVGKKLVGKKTRFGWGRQ